MQVDPALAVDLVGELQDHRRIEIVVDAQGVLVAGDGDVKGRRERGQVQEIRVNPVEGGEPIASDHLEVRQVTIERAVIAVGDLGVEALAVDVATDNWAGLLPVAGVLGPEVPAPPVIAEVEVPEGVVGLEAGA